MLQTRTNAKVRDKTSRAALKNVTVSIPSSNTGTAQAAQVEADNIYYLNPFALVVQKGENLYLASDAKHLSLDSPLEANQSQQNLINLLSSGKGVFFLTLCEGFGTETIQSWVETGILITELPEKDDFCDRASAYLQQAGFPNDQRLKNSSVMILGCGGIGTHVAWDLLCAGVGHLILVDGDTITRSNLNRQVLYFDEDIGSSKVETLKDNLQRIYPGANITAVDTFIDNEVVLEALLDKFRIDLIVKSLDTPESVHLWIDQACANKKVSSISGTFSSTFCLVGPLYDARNRTACYSDFFPDSHEYTHISGMTPSISFTASYAASRIAVAATNFLISRDGSRFTNRIEAVDLLTGQIDEYRLKTSEFEPYEERRFSRLYVMIALFTAITGIIMANGEFLIPLISGLLIPLVCIGLFRTRNASVRASFIVALWHFLVCISTFFVVNRATLLALGFFEIVALIFAVFVGISCYLLLITALTFAMASLKNRLMTGRNQK